MSDINVKDLFKWKDEQKIIYASDTDKKKKLIYTLQGNYEMWRNGKIMNETIPENQAVSDYNDI